MVRFKITSLSGQSVHLTSANKPAAIMPMRTVINNSTYEFAVGKPHGSILKRSVFRGLTKPTESAMVLQHGRMRPIEFAGCEKSAMYL